MKNPNFVIVEHFLFIMRPESTLKFSVELLICLRVESMIVWDCANVLAILFAVLVFLSVFTVPQCVCSQRFTGSVFTTVYLYVLGDGGMFVNSLIRQKTFFSSADLRFVFVSDSDCDEGRGRGELLPSSNFASSLLSDQPLAVS